uniref:Peptidase M48 domain-containing protein n=1 Tax=Ditylenchus dipsaci TaxID=166011 RepID=A0A915EBE4_9BILA
MEPKDSLVLPFHHPDQPSAPKPSWLASISLDYYLTYRQYSLVSSIEWRPPELSAFMSEFEYLRVRHVNIENYKAILWSCVVEAIVTCVVLLTNFLPWTWKILGNGIKRSRNCCSSWRRKKQAAIDGFEDDKPVGEIKQSIAFYLVFSLGVFRATPDSRALPCLHHQTAPKERVVFKVDNTLVAYSPYFLFVDGFGNAVAGFSLPLPEGQLKMEVDKFAEKLQFPPENIYVAETSAVFQNMSNAYYAGMFVNKRIVFFDTMLGYAPDDLENGIKPNPTTKAPNMTNHEVIAVLAHELGHWKGQHIFYKFIIQQIRLIIYLVMLAAFYQNKRLHAALGFMKQRPIIIGLFIVANFVSVPINEPIGLVNNIISQQIEYSADRFAMDYNYAEHLCHALLKIRSRNQMPLVDPLYSLFKEDHGGTLQRCKQMNVKLIEIDSFWFNKFGQV